MEMAGDIAVVFVISLGFNVAISLATQGHRSIHFGWTQICVKRLVLMVEAQEGLLDTQGSAMQEGRFKFLLRFGVLLVYPVFLI